MQYFDRLTTSKHKAHNAPLGDFVMKRSSLVPALIALACLAALLTGCSRDPNVRKQKYFESGQRYFAEGKYREAVIQFRNATQVDGRYAEAHYQLGQAYLKTQDWQHAYTELARTLGVPVGDLKRLPPSRGRPPSWLCS